MGCAETSVSNYHYSLRNDPEERSSHLIRSGSLKSRKGRTTRILLRLFYTFMTCYRVDTYEL